MTPARMPAVTVSQIRRPDAGRGDDRRRRRRAALGPDHERPLGAARSSARSRAFCGGRPVRVADVGDRRDRGRAAALRHRPRRRSDHGGAELFHRAQHDRQGRRDAGVRRLRSGHAQHRPRRRSRRRSRRAREAIMPTHWPGSLVDMDALYALARRRGLRVIEDAALVIGSRWRGQNVGAFGDLVTFSFHPNKNMTSIEGGALVVNDAGRSAARRGAALPRHQLPARPHARRRVSRRQVQPARRQRAHRRRAARAAAGVPRQAPRAGRPLLRALRDRSGVRAAAAAGQRGRRPVLEHVLACCCRSTA